MREFTILELDELQRGLTEENAGRVSVHLEYRCRISPIFHARRGLTSIATRTAWRSEGKRKEHLLDTLLVMRMELKRRLGIKRYFVLKRLYARS
jgi:hypothetical protein